MELVEQFEFGVGESAFGTDEADQVFFTVGVMQDGIGLFGRLSEKQLGIGVIPAEGLNSLVELGGGVDLGQEPAVALFGGGNGEIFVTLLAFRRSGELNGAFEPDRANAVHAQFGAFADEPIKAFALSQGSGDNNSSFFWGLMTGDFFDFKQNSLAVDFADPGQGGGSAAIEKFDGIAWFEAPDLFEMMGLIGIKL